MVCEGEYVFKGLTTRDGGKFKNDRGDVVQYKEVYVLQVDEKCDDGRIIERKFKFSKDNEVLAEKLRGIEPYENIIITFDVSIYSTGVKLNPVSVELV